jgi:hypothetical protein
MRDSLDDRLWLFVTAIVPITGLVAAIILIALIFLHDWMWPF